jgi:hypothetical protein
MERPDARRPFKTHHRGDINRFAARYRYSQDTRDATRISEAVALNALARVKNEVRKAGAQRAGKVVGSTYPDESVIIYTAHWDHSAAISLAPR